MLILLAPLNSTLGNTLLSSQIGLTYNDPSGQGQSVFTLFYSIPQQVQVGSNLTIPIKLFVDNLTSLEVELLDYNVTISLGLQREATIGNDGGQRERSRRQPRRTPVACRDGVGAGHVTMPLTTSNTGLGQGQEALANTTVAVLADVYFNQPANTVRFQEAQARLGYSIIADGNVSSTQTNYVGLAVFAIGVVLLVAAVVTRKSSAPVRAAGPAPARSEDDPGHTDGVSRLSSFSGVPLRSG